MPEDGRFVDVKQAIMDACHENATVVAAIRAFMVHGDPEKVTDAQRKEVADWEERLYKQLVIVCGEALQPYIKNCLDE